VSVELRFPGLSVQTLVVLWVYSSCCLSGMCSLGSVGEVHCPCSFCTDEAYHAHTPEFNDYRSFVPRAQYTRFGGLPSVTYQQPAGSLEVNHGKDDLAISRLFQLRQLPAGPNWYSSLNIVEYPEAI
jgi:hypothetical protein